MPETASVMTRAALLRARRERALLSQEELAARAGLSVRTVRNIETGRLARPHPETVRRISQALTAAGAPVAEHGTGGGPDRPQRRRPVHQLPPAIADFTGRDAEVRRLRALLERDADGIGAARVLSVTGLAGVGKTSLAVHVAHLVRSRFPDGQLYVDLLGAGPPAQRSPRDPDEVLAQFLLALGVEGTAIPDGTGERAALYRSVLDGCRMLVVLDNAADESQVRPLLAAAEGCAHLVTSRVRLLGLEGARTLMLDVLDSGEASELLGRIAGTDRAGQPAAERIGSACGGLPLAIRVAAARLAARPHWGADTLADLLDDERGRLDELTAGDLGVRASFELSYHTLDAGQRRAFRGLALIDAADFPAWVLAAALDEADAPVGDAAPRRPGTLLEQLVDAQLVQVTGRDAAGQARYRLHDLLRVYGRERALAEDAPADRRAALCRVLSGWLALAERAEELLPSGEHLPLPRVAPRWQLPAPVREALVAPPADWFAAERAALVSAVAQAAELGCAGLACELAGSLTAFFELRSRHDDWQHTHETALAAARRTGDTQAQGLLLCRLGNLHLDRNQLDQALDALHAALVAHRSAADARGESHTLQALSHAHRLRGQPDAARSCAEAAIVILQRSGEQRGLAGARYYLGTVLVEQGAHTDALTHLHLALEADEAAGDRRGAAMTSLQLARTHLALGDLLAARRCALHCLDAQREVGDRRGRAYALVTLGEIEAAQQRLDDAGATLRSALRLAAEHQDRQAEAHSHRALGELRLLRGEPSLAVDPLCRALALFSELDLPRWRTRTLHALQHARGTVPVSRR